MKIHTIIFPQALNVFMKERPQPTCNVVLVEKFFAPGRPFIKEI